MEEERTTGSNTLGRRVRSGSRKSRLVVLSVALLLILLSLSSTSLPSFLPFMVPAVKASPGWLSGWDKRVKITIDHNDVSSGLSNFPLLIYLSASSGRFDDDVSFVFDELQSDANRMKIAVTTSDETTQCYVEIERWETASKKAWLWVKVPSISSSADTDLYLYYDKDHADNTNYVGDTNSAAAENVWDSNFLAVYHMAQAPTGTIYDSTSNNVDLTSYGGMAAGNLVDGEIGKAIDFDGSDDLLNSSAQITFQSFTLEAWASSDTWAPGPTWTWRTFLSCYGDARDFASKNGDMVFWDDADATYYIGPTLPLTTWKHVAVRYDNSASTDRLRGFVDGAITSQTGNNPSYVSITGEVKIACTYDIVLGGWIDFFDGKIDEVRISKTPRTEAWMRTTYESGRDDLIDFGSEESGEVDTYQSDYSTLKDIYSIGETVYAKGINLNTGSLYDFKYFKTGEGSPRSTESNVPENPSNEWRSGTCVLQSGWPTGDWEVRVYDAGTSTLRCSAPFTVQAVPEFPYGAVVALIAGFAIFLAKRKALERRGEAS